MKYKIESNIPIPPRKGTLDPHSLSGHLRILKKGQSIFLKGNRASIANNALKVFGKGGSAVRSVNGGFRVWRIK